MKTTTVLLLLIAALLAVAALPSSAARDLKNPSKPVNNQGAPNLGSNPGAGFIPEVGSLPQFGGTNNWGNLGGGYGAGYGGPGGGYAHSGTVRPSVVCSEPGPCYKKKVTCPAKCFTSFSSFGKNSGAGGGGGGCTIDCKKNCVAYC